MKIPFKFLPASWGLKGKSYKRAEAEYLYDGKDLDYALLDVEFEGSIETYEYLLKKIALDKKYGNASEYDYEKAKVTYSDIDVSEKEKELLKIDRKFNQITEEEFNRRMATLSFTGDDLVLENLFLDFKEGKISEREYEKQRATLKGEAWVDGIIRLDGKGQTYVEIDYNTIFVEGLRDKGYAGLTDDDVIEMWWTNVHMHDIEDNTEPFQPQTRQLGDGKTEVK